MEHAAFVPSVYSQPVASKRVVPIPSDRYLVVFFIVCPRSRRPASRIAHGPEGQGGARRRCGSFIRGVGRRGGGTCQGSEEFVALSAGCVLVIRFREIESASRARVRSLQTAGLMCSRM